MHLIGRDQERADLARRVASGCRLVTIIGPGGVGKTSLAVTAGAELAAEFPLGTHVVDLTRIERSDSVGGALAAQLGFASFDALLQSPSDQPALVVVDNCEHVSDAAADAIARLLDACAAPTVLATSRSPLDLPGESVLALGPLDVPAADHVDGASGALLLLCDRAEHAGVPVDADQLPLAAELCRRLDGLPLAIEIAAARMRSLVLADIIDLLDGGIDVLSRPRFRGARRHRSLRDTITWSYRLLDPEDQVAFDRLGVCAGPFPVELAAAVAFDPPVASAATLDVLDRLVDASLLAVDRPPTGTRYRMLATVRAVAQEHLAAREEWGAVRDRFATEVIGAVERIGATGRRRWPAELLPALLDRFDDIDTALRYCLSDDRDPARAMQLYAALWSTVQQARVDEVVALGRLLTDRWPEPSPEAAATLAMATLLAGRPADAVAIAERAMPGTGDRVFAAVALRRVLALAARGAGDHDGAAALLAEAVLMAAEHDVPTIEMECEVYLAQDLAAAEAPGEALRIVRAVAGRAAEAESVLNELWARTVEGAILLAQGDPAAEAVVEATLARAEAIDYPFAVTGNLLTLARCHLAAGDLAGAAAVVLRLFDAVGRSGAGDLRVALDLGGAVLHAARRPGGPDLRATGATLPETNPMVLGRLAVPAPDAAPGRVLARGDAVRLARQALGPVAAGEGAPDRVDTPPAGARPAEAVFVPAGDVWDVRFAGTGVHLKGSKGMDDLAVLLAAPGREIHCLDLAGAGVDEPATGVAIDETARRRYEARVRELQADIDEAEAAHDRARAERAQAELDALVDHLTAALGLGGRARAQGGTAARARSAVTHRLRATMRRIADVHPALGHHLQASVTTGIYCRYQPAEPVDWQL